MDNAPIYIITGFLESGKTKFAQETLQDATFNNGDRMLLLVCEEGIEEYEPASFAAPNIFMEVIEEESQLTADYLASLLKSTAASTSLWSTTACGAWTPCTPICPRTGWWPRSSCLSTPPPS